jgi:formiminotetrahydrofolate cyclodeaminase
MYKNRSLKRYLDDLAAKLPAPGGGSASALVAALGCCLLSMVANFTIGKTKYKRFEREIKKVLNLTETYRKRLLDLVDLDVKSFKEKNINKATETPLEVCHICAEMIKLCGVLEKKGNQNLISDVGCAREFLRAGFRGALENVRINLSKIKDKNLIKKITKSLKSWRYLLYG